MGYKMKGSPAKLGSIQGTSGHKAALEASPNKMTAGIATAMTKVAGDVAKGTAKVVKGIGKTVGKIIGKGGGKGKGTGIKTSSTGAVSNKEAATLKKSSTVPRDAEGKVKMTQQVKQEAKLKKVSERRRSKGK